MIAFNTFKCVANNKFAGSKGFRVSQMAGFSAASKRCCLFLLLVPGIALVPGTALSQAGVQATTENIDNSAEGAASKTGRSWRDFFRSTRNQRRQLQEEGQYESLARETGDARWSAAFQYREGDYTSAIESYAQLPGEQSLYNAATAHAHAGDYQQSLDTYDRLLEQNPQHEDALHNRAIVEQLMQQQQQQGGGQQQNEDNQTPEGEQQQSENSEGGGQQQPADTEQQPSEQQQSGNQSEQQPGCPLYTSPSPRDATLSRMPSSA